MDRYRVSYTYTIRECRSEPVAGDVEIEDGNVRNFTLTGLEEDSDYTIMLSAIRNDRHALSDEIHTQTRKAGECVCSFSAITSIVGIVYFSSIWYS